MLRNKLLIKLLFILLLVVGCDYAPTEHTHEHEHDTTHEHDDIYGCTDSTSTNFDSTAIIFDNTCEYPITEFAVDWILIKNAEYVREESDAESGIVFTYTGRIYPEKQDCSKFLIAISNLIEENYVDSEKIEFNYYGHKHSLTER